MTLNLAGKEFVFICLQVSAEEWQGVTSENNVCGDYLPPERHLQNSKIVPPAHLFDSKTSTAATNNAPPSRLFASNMKFRYFPSFFGRFPDLLLSPQAEMKWWRTSFPLKRSHLHQKLLYAGNQVQPIKHGLWGCMSKQIIHKSLVSPPRMPSPSGKCLLPPSD